MGALIAIIGAAYAISEQNDIQSARAGWVVTLLGGIIAIVGIIAGSVVGAAKPAWYTNIRESGIRETLKPAWYTNIREFGIRETLKPARMRAVPLVIAGGAAVFLFGFGMACLAGYQAHNLTNEYRPLDQEFDDYQVLTVIGIIMASVGIGIVTYGDVFENHRSDASMTLKSAIVIGAVISAICFGTAIWAALVTIHMGVLPGLQLLRV